MYGASCGEEQAGPARRFLRLMSSDLARFLGASQRLVVLTGAGCSTASGIPDYRSPGGAWTRHKPILYSAFVRSEEVRRFYWARSYRGWPRFAAAAPNATHRELAALESDGKVHFLITQNVDDLHQEAGSSRLVQLHGRNRMVVCLGCSIEVPRAEVQAKLGALNEEWLAAAPWSRLRGDEADFAPDGDAEVGRDVIDGFRLVACEKCGGVLKPAVVFFGETVPPQKVALSMQRLSEADALLVVGSSLTVWSGFRFVKRAGELGIPVAIVNRGETRGDALASLKVDGECGAALAEARRLLMLD